MKTTRAIYPKPLPTFQTARLLIRPMVLSDLHDCHQLRSQPEVMKWTSVGKVDADLDITQTWLNRFLPPNDTTTFNFSIEELDSPGKVVGVIGVHFPEPPECGYMFRRESWGRGYATEALKKFIEVWWSLERKQVELNYSKDGDGQEANPSKAEVEVLKATIEGTNVGSRRVLEKCGFELSYDEKIEENGKVVPLSVYHLQRPQQ